MPKIGTNIYKRKDGRWEGRYIKHYLENGKAKYGYVYSRTYREVRLKLKEKSVVPKLRDHGLDMVRNITFAELSGLWLASSKHRIKPSTFATYTNMLERYILPSLGSYGLKSLSNDTVKRFVDEKAANGRTDGCGLSPKTIRDILSIINSIIRYAEEENYLPKSRVTIKYPKSYSKKMRVLSKEEQQKLEAVLLSGMDLCKFGVLVCLYTGLRIGEVCALKWSDISLQDGAITVRQTLQRIKNLDNNNENKTKIIFDDPKSDCSRRDIPIPFSLISYFNSFFPENKNTYFLTGQETKFIEPRTFQNHFKAYVRQSGIADANFHSLRHTFSTRCIEAEFDIKSLSEILGHKNVNITLNRYVHPSFDLKKKNMMKLRLISV